MATTNKPDLLIPDSVINDVTKKVNASLGRSDERVWSNGQPRSVFNQHVGALVCRNCGHLNVPEATACQECAMQYEVSIFVGHKPQPMSEEEKEIQFAVGLDELGSILNPPVETKP